MRAPSSVVISIVNGWTEIFDCTFSNIQVLTSVVHVWDEDDDTNQGMGMDLVAIRGNRTMVDTEGRDPSTYYCAKADYWWKQ
jgi:hypothetical protein